MYDTTLNYEAHFFISGQDGSPAGTELSGIDSLDLGYDNSANVVEPLGSRLGVTTVGQAVSQKVSFSRSLIYNDPVLAFTGESEVMKGSFNYDNNL